MRASRYSDLRRSAMVNRILTVALFAFALLIPPSARAVALDELEPMLSSNTRLMVFTPHPDDESLGAGGLIQRVLSEGGRVKVVFVTSGNGFSEGVEKERHRSHPTAVDFLKYGKEREGEAIRAMGILGVKRKDINFLGFPDAVLSNLIAKFPSDPFAYTSPFTLVNHPPATDIVVRHTYYSGRDLTKELMWVLADFRPNLVATTPTGGQHPDHCATYYFVAKALMEMGKKDPAIKPKVLNFVIHFRHWPMDTTAGSCLNPPEGFPDKAHEKEVKWLSLSLSTKEEETKREAIRQYHSQMVIMDSYMFSFVRPNEIFMVERQWPAKETEEMPWCAEGVLN